MPEAARKHREAALEAPDRILVLATDELAGPEIVGELLEHFREAATTEVMVIAPAIQKTAFQHALGDVDGPARMAGRRLEISLEELGRAGVVALGEIGDSDPLIAARDALQQFAADEVLIVAHAEDQARWFEDGLFERAQTELHPAVRMVTVRRDEDDPEPHLVSVQDSAPGRRPVADPERGPSLSPNLPRPALGDLAGIAIAIVGTIAAAVLAAVGPGPNTPGGAAQILIAMGIALVNLAHVVGLTLFESVGHRGGWQRFLRDLSLLGTPLAVLANGLISLLA